MNATCEEKTVNASVDVVHRGEAVGVERLYLEIPVQIGFLGINYDFILALFVEFCQFFL